MNAPPTPVREPAAAQSKAVLDKRAALCTDRIAALHKQRLLAREAEECGDIAAVRHAEAAALREFDRLLTEIRGTLTRHTHEVLGNDPDLVKDGAQELVVALFDRVNHLGETPSDRAWMIPELFFLTLRRFARKQLIRHVQRDYGNKAQEVRVGDLPQGSGAEEDADSDPNLRVADPHADAAREALERDDALRVILNAIPDPRHRDALIYSAAGWPKEAIARRIGCSVRSVHLYEKAARAQAWAFAHQRFQQAGEFEDWISHDKFLETHKPNHHA